MKGCYLRAVCGFNHRKDIQPRLEPIKILGAMELSLKRVELSLKGLPKSSPLLIHSTSKCQEERIGG